MSDSKSNIFPDRNYSIREACEILPSSLPGKRVHPATLHDWRKAGKLQAIQIGHRFFVPGWELLRLLRG